MTEREAIERIKKDICCERHVQHYCDDSCMYGKNKCAYQKAIKALENQNTLLDFLVSIEISNICEDDRMCEWCEEHCAYACPQKECYLKYAEIERNKNER